MKEKAVSLGFPALALVGGVAGNMLRRVQLGGESGVPLLALTLVCALLFALAAIALKKQTAFAAVYHRFPADLVLTAFGSLAIVVGCAMALPTATTVGKILSLLGVLGAIGLAIAAKLRLSGNTPQPFFLVLAVLFYAAKLFYDFRHWMVDPAITDYAFSLFALICFMLVTYQSTAFCCDKGSRRQLVFFSLMGVVFGGTAIAGSATADLLIYGGSTLCMLACAMQGCAPEANIP